MNLERQLRREGKVKRDYETMAKVIIEKVGGKENVNAVYHCTTRLRFDLRDQNLADDEALKKTEGILGVVKAGGQYQVIIGQDVADLYKVLCKEGHFAANSAIDENLDGPKEKLTVKKVLNNILNYVSGSITALIPAFCAGALFKTLGVVIGSSMLKLVEESSDIYRLFDFVYDACFYFLPVYLGYSAAKKLNTNVILGMLLGGIYLAPDFVEIAMAGEPFRVLGIPATLTTYGSTIFPILMSVAAMKYIDQFFEKIIPDVLKVAFKPFFVVLVMLPLSLCVFGPLGGMIGKGLASLTVALHNAPIITGLIGGLWPFIIMSGMHIAIGQSVIIPNLYAKGYDEAINPAMMCANAAMFGMLFGAFLKIRDKKEKTLVMGYLLTDLIGSISEPALFGVGMKYKKTLACLALGGVVGGLFGAFSGAIFYLAPQVPVIGGLLGFIQGGTGNVVKYLIGAILAFNISAVTTYFFGFDKDEPVIQKGE